MTRYQYITNSNLTFLDSSYQGHRSELVHKRCTFYINMIEMSFLQTWKKGQTCGHCLQNILGECGNTLISRPRKDLNFSHVCPLEPGTFFSSSFQKAPPPLILKYSQLKLGTFFLFFDDPPHPPLIGLIPKFRCFFVWKASLSQMIEVAGQEQDLGKKWDVFRDQRWENLCSELPCTHTLPAGLGWKPSPFFSSGSEQDIVFCAGLAIFLCRLFEIDRLTVS